MAEDITRLSLNDIPSNQDFEDFISAYLLLGGYTLDRSIHEKVEGAGELFEVDIVSHQYKEKHEKCLIEIKSGNWSLNDIFKVGGRLRYLGMDSGAFIVQDKIDEKKFDAWTRPIKERMDVSLIYVGKQNPTDTKLNLNDLFNGFGIDNSIIDEAAIESIRFSYIAERCMRSRVSQLNKSHQTEGIRALWDFSSAIQDLSFYSDDPVQRLHRTFSLFKEYNHLSARLDSELLHKTFPSAEQISTFESGRVMSYLLNNTDYLPVNYSMYLEHRLRMYIIQSCVEYLVMPKEFQNEMDEFLNQCSFNALSKNIISGISYLANKCPNFRLYPRLWHLFTYMLGGFLLNDHFDEEIGLLSQYSGVPMREMGNCFAVYDVLFPTDKSWLRDLGKSCIKRLNFMPAPIMGIGANFRRFFYRINKEDKDPQYIDLEGRMAGVFELKNLMEWNRAAFNLLRRSSDVQKS